MYDNGQFARIKLINSIVHWYKSISSDVHLFDILSKQQLKRTIDLKVPGGCRTIAISKDVIYLIGGCDSNSLNSTWEYTVVNNKIVAKKGMN